MAKAKAVERGKSWLLVANDGQSIPLRIEDSGYNNQQPTQLEFPEVIVANPFEAKFGPG